MYDTKSTDRELLVKLDNTIWSLSAAYTVGASTFLIARQAVNRTGGYTYGVDGNSTVFVTNSILHSDLNYADEKSWQARYDLNMAPSSVPGLLFMSCYGKGTDFDPTLTKNGETWERDIKARYVIQNGPAKDLSLPLRHASYRSSNRDG